jgi:hypothetical protein
LGLSKDYTYGVCCFAAKHISLRSKNKDWLARHQNNHSLTHSLTHCVTNSVRKESYCDYNKWNISVVICDTDIRNLATVIFRSDNFNLTTRSPLSGNYDRNHKLWNIEST